MSADPGSFFHWFDDVAGTMVGHSFIELIKMGWGKLMGMRAAIEDVITKGRPEVYLRIRKIREDGRHLERLEKKLNESCRDFDDDEVEEIIIAAFQGLRGEPKTFGNEELDKAVHALAQAHRDVYSASVGTVQLASEHRRSTEAQLRATERLRDKAFQAMSRGNQAARERAELEYDDAKARVDILKEEINELREREWLEQESARDVSGAIVDLMDQEVQGRRNARAVDSDRKADQLLVLLNEEAKSTARFHRALRALDKQSPLVWLWRKTKRLSYEDFQKLTKWAYKQAELLLNSFCDEIEKIPERPVNRDGVKGCFKRLFFIR